MRDGLVVSVLDFRSEGRWFDPSLYRRVFSLAIRTLFQIVSHHDHPGVKMGTGDQNAEGSLAMD